MYFYDIMLLYNRYEQYVKDENERAKADEENANAEITSQPNYGSITKSVSEMTGKVGSLTADSISRGIVGLK